MPWAVASQELYCSDSQAERFLNEAVKRRSIYLWQGGM